MSKLRLWQLPYDGVFYLDADAFAMEGLRKVWGEFAALGMRVRGEPGKYHSGFNAGAMALRPSNATFQRLMLRGEHSGPPGLFNNVVDCTEQALLNAHFSC